MGLIVSRDCPHCGTPSGPFQLPPVGVPTLYVCAQCRMSTPLDELLLYGLDFPTPPALGAWDRAVANEMQRIADEIEYNLRRSFWPDEDGCCGGAC